jgi:hypothetical protein
MRSITLATSTVAASSAARAFLRAHPRHGGADPRRDEAAVAF